MAKNKIIPDNCGLLTINEGDANDRIAGVLNALSYEIGEECGQDFNCLIHKRIAGLPFVWRSVFVMKYLENQTPPVICNELNLSPANYWKICSRVKADLKGHLAKHLRFIGER